MGAGNGGAGVPGFWVSPGHVDDLRLCRGFLSMLLVWVSLLCKPICEGAGEVNQCLCSFIKCLLCVNTLLTTGDTAVTKQVAALKELTF